MFKTLRMRTPQFAAAMVLAVLTLAVFTAQAAGTMVKGWLYQDTGNGKLIMSKSTNKVDVGSGNGEKYVFIAIKDTPDGDMVSLMLDGATFDCVSKCILAATYDGKPGKILHGYEPDGASGNMVYLDPVDSGKIMKMLKQGKEDFSILAPYSSGRKIADFDLDGFDPSRL